MRLARRRDGWWIEGRVLDCACGPYATRHEALEGKRGLKRFFRDNPRLARKVSEMPKKASSTVDSATLSVKKADVIRLFSALGFASAAKVSDARLLGRLEKLDELMEEEQQLEEDDLQQLAEDIKEAVAEGRTIEIDDTSEDATAGEDEAEEDDGTEEEETVPIRKKRGPRNKKKGSAKPADEEDEMATATKPKKRSAKAAEKNGKAPKDTKPAKAGKKTAAKSAKGGIPRVGVIATIVDLLKGASAKNPLHRDDIVAALKKKFPDREESGMKVTVYSQVPLRLRNVKGLDVKETDDKKYYI